MIHGSSFGLMVGFGCDTLFFQDIMQVDGNFIMMWGMFTGIGPLIH